MKRLMCLLLVGLTFANVVDSQPPIPKTPFELYSHELPYTPKKGKIVVSFMIDENGKVEQPKILDTFDRYLNRIVIDKLEQTKYKPALQNGRPVRVRYQLPIIFR
tara:strand:+ start:58 stop:372 length:315 start_codon:yes stop_codon:yes gene_type:complete